MAKKKKVVATRLSNEILSSVKSVKQNAGGKSIKKSLAAVSSDLRKTRNPIYKINKQLRSDEISSYKKRKLRKELNTYKSSVAEKISTLIQKRNELKGTIKNIDEVNREKAKIRREIGSLESRIRAAEKNNDFDLVAELSLVELNRIGRLKNLNEALGITTKGKDIKKRRKPGGEFQNDPLNQYPFWEGVEMVYQDIKGGLWDYFILDGVKTYIDPKQRAVAKATALSYFISINANSKTKLERYMNYKTKTTKYIVVQL